MAALRNNRLLEPGVRAPDFELEELGGGSKTLRDVIASGPAVLAFFKISCPVCQFTFPFLERMDSGGSGRFFAVSQDDAEATREFHKEFGITFPTLLDSEDRGYPASNAFGISHVPTLFLVEQNGEVSQVVDGFIKKEMETLGTRMGVSPFQAGESVPDWRAG